MIASEAIKTLVFELVTNGGEAGFDPKGAKALADALFSATRAQGVSTSRRQKVEAEFKENVKATLKTVGEKAGISQESLDEINRVLGAV